MNLFNMLIKVGNDETMNELLENSKVKKQFFFLTLSSIISLLLALVTVVSIMLTQQDTKVVAIRADMKNKTLQQMNIMPMAHSSFKNVSEWINEAISTAYSFDFLDFDKQVDKARIYFTDKGYEMYLGALAAEGVREVITTKKVQSTLIPTGSPVLINSGNFAGIDFWRFRVKALVVYYGGLQPVFKRVNISLLIFRHPPHLNPKGLAISEFMMNYDD